MVLVKSVDKDSVKNLAANCLNHFFCFLDNNGNKIASFPIVRELPNDNRNAHRFELINRQINQFVDQVHLIQANRIEMISVAAILLRSSNFISLPSQFLELGVDHDINLDEENEDISPDIVAMARTRTMENMTENVVDYFNSIAGLHYTVQQFNNLSVAERIRDMKEVLKAEGRVLLTATIAVNNPQGQNHPIDTEMDISHMNYFEFNILIRYLDRHVEIF